MHLRSVGYTDTVLFPTIGNAAKVQSPDIGKPDIYGRKDQVSWQPILVIIGHLDKTIADLPKPLSRQISGLPIERNGTVSVYPIEFNAFASGIPMCREIKKVSFLH